MIKHIAFIMDGNRRYGKKQKISNKEAYKKGMEKFLEFVSFQVKYNIKETSFFALSSENYIKRSRETELNVIFDLMKSFANNKNIENFFVNNKIKIFLKGNIEEIKKKEKKTFKKDSVFIEDLIRKFEEFNQKIKKSRFIVNIALNYGGQKEILHSFKEILKKIDTGKINKNTVTEKTLKQHMWFCGNEPEIIVRPGNVQRLSGFMLWDSQYSEIYFTNKLWPEMDEADFVKILQWYKNIVRNFGK